jgi:hypothetical protein
MKSQDGRFELIAADYARPIPDFDPALTCKVIADNLIHIGIGTATPTEELEVFGEIKLNTGRPDGPRLIWQGGTNGNQKYHAKVGPDGELKFFPIEGIPGDSATLTLTQDYKVGIGMVNPSARLHVNGNIIATGTITPGSSREYKENIADLTVQEAFKTLYGLNPTKFNYKAEKNKDLHVGFIAEEVPELVATSDRKGVDPMDIVAVLTKVVQKQQKTIEALENRVTALEEQIKSGKLP